ncbi:MAG: hypothetical protein ACYTEZ_13340 [Planctomycetota bacterium]|jgi:hypothetical protein
MPRRRFTTGRVFALLILGVAIGITLYVLRHLRPESLEQQVALELRNLIATDFEVDDVRLGLDTGVELVGLKVFYPREGDQDPVAAIEAERITLLVDHKELLRGEVEILQVDVEGLVVRLRYANERESVPSLPGVFREAGPAPARLAAALPALRILPGDHGSRLEILNSRSLRRGVPFRLRCRNAEGRTDGLYYSLRAELEGDRLEQLTLKLALDPAERTLDVRADLRGLSWAREDIRLLSPAVRERLPPLEFGGQADASAEAHLRLDAFDPDAVKGKASFRHLEGVFGNVYTLEPKGLPFAVRKGSAELSFGGGRFSLSDFEATYVSPSGVEGVLTAKMELALVPAGHHLDLTVNGRAIHTSTEDMRNLLPPDIVHNVVEQFLPAGTFDFDVTVVQRPKRPERVVADLKVSSGKLSYAGRLDELTGKRFGFRYPLDRCAGRIRVETNVPTPRGLTDVIEVTRMHGKNRVARPREGDPQDVEVEAKGRVVVYASPDGVPREDIDLGIHVRDLPIDAKLAEAFASTPGGMPYKDFDLTGWADTVEIQIRREAFGANEPRATYDVRLRDCTLAYNNFPLVVEDVWGRIVSRDLPRDEQGGSLRLLEFEGLRGQAKGGGELTCEGSVLQSDDRMQGVDLTVVAQGLTVGEELEQALLASPAGGTGVADAWHRLRPHGRLYAEVTMKEPGKARIRIDLAQTAFGGYGDIDCPITELAGQITYEEGAVTLQDVEGKIFEAPFHIEGGLREGGSVDVRASVDRLVLNPPVVRILGKVLPEAQRLAEGLGLTEDSSFNLVLRLKRDGADGATEVTCVAGSLDLTAHVQNLELDITGGPIRVDENELTATEIWLKVGDAEVSVRELHVPHDHNRPAWAVLDAQHLEPQGHLEKLFGPEIRKVLGENLRVDLTGFRIELAENQTTVILSGAVDLRRYALQEAEDDALEPTGRVGLRPLTLKLPAAAGGHLRFHGVVEFDGFNMNLPLAVRDMSGQLLVAEGTLAPDFSLRGAISGGHAFVFDRHLQEMSLNFSFRPEHLHLGNIDGRFYEGVFRGDVEVHLTNPGAFKVRFRATDVELGELLKEDLPRSEPMSGTLAAALEFESASGEPHHMHGRGEVRVSEGQLFRIPGLRRILAVLSRVTPLDSSPRFERAEADFIIEGETLKVRQVHLATDLNDVYGRGTVTIYGDLDFVVEPQVTKAIDLPRFFNLPVLSTLRDIWHKTVYEIRLEGTIDSPALRLRALPFLKNKRRQFTQSPHAGRAVRMRPRLLPGNASPRPKAVPVGEPKGPGSGAAAEPEPASDASR